MALTKLLKSFASRQDGGVAILFGLSLIGLGLAAGIALDYARTFSIESDLRSDLDAAVLGAASKMNDPAAIQAAALAVFDENWRARHGVSSVSLTVTKTDDTKLTGTATAEVPTTLMKLGGFNSISLQAISEVEVAGGDVEVSMVLDTTASMAGAKLDALKTAAKALIETAYEAPDADQHVKIGIVPFGQYVNVGMDNRNASWMSVAADSSTPRQSCGMESPVTGESNCRMETVNTTQDGQPYSYDHQVCDYTYGTPVYVCNDYNDVVAWYGCAGSRDNPLDTLDEQYGTPVPGIMNTTCGSPVLPLTNNTTALNAQIDALVASGDTYIPAGLMWGWSALSGAAPFAEATAYGARVDGKPVLKVMVLMTDGFNTLSPDYPTHGGSDRTLSNGLTAELCTNIKAKDIKIYTVAFEVTDNAVKDILEACASSPSNFYDATDSDQLATVFKTIAQDFTPLRLSR